MKSSQIVLYGPPIGKNIKKGYGGGSGGYTRNMSAYLNFQFDSISLSPLFHTVRGEIDLGIFTFLIRSFVDLRRIIQTLIFNRPKGIHVLAQYRRAVVREFALSVFAKMLRIPYIYEIKAGSFIDFCEKSGTLNSFYLRYVLNNAKVVLCEGKKYIPYLEKTFSIKGHYFPNFVLSTEIPENPNVLFESDILRVLFVGYCTRDKGVYELVEGASSFAEKRNVKVELTLVGSEDPDFSKFIEEYPISNNLKVTRSGRLAHKDVLVQMSKNDIYCYPTRHRGEGHNNSINEAMMFGLVVITTKAGFLPEVLENSAFYIDDVESTEIYSALSRIQLDKGGAMEKARRAHHKLLSSYTDSVVYERLKLHYKQLVTNSKGS
ncbi:MAG: glycosyltransferase family 4 protein [Alphaproteobacteria bacterium]|nr:glycosyltransferase family 4 protein [Alphaproteobacteria bacterium]